MEHHRYRLYVLEHRPDLYFDLRGIEIPARRIVVVPLKMATPRCFVWREVATGHRIWSPRENVVREYSLPYAEDVCRAARPIPTLAQTSFCHLSTMDVSIARRYLLSRF